MKLAVALGALLAVAVAGCQPDGPDSRAPASAPAPSSASSPSESRSPSTAAKGETSVISGLPLVPLEIRSGGKVHRFTVEVARTPDEQAYGLMNRTSLGPYEGMVFPFPSPRPASFWMKNTLIPLDMIFVRADGSVARIAAMTRPHSLDPVE
jgi:uncharacterized membrane protein (UPF0127 family)